MIGHHGHRPLSSCLGVCPDASPTKVESATQGHKVILPCSISIVSSNPEVHIQSNILIPGYI